MGEIVEAMLKGIFCMRCGVFLGNAVGHERYCKDCADGDPSIPKDLVFKGKLP